MKKLVKITALVLVIALAAMLFVGCGKKNEKLTMLTNAAFAPFEYLDAEGKVAGVDVEVAQAIADELGYELEVVDMDFDGIPAAVQAGKGDLGVAGMSITEERMQYVDFSVPYVNTTILIVVNEDSAIATTDDLTGKTIGVQLGTTSDLFASDLDAEVARYKTSPDAIAELLNGKIDAVIMDEMPANDALKNNEGLKILDEPLTTEQYAIALAKDSKLTETVNKVLEKLVADGTIDKLVEKHMALAAEVG